MFIPGHVCAGRVGSDGEATGSSGDGDRVSSGNGVATGSSGDGVSSGEGEVTASSDNGVATGSSGNGVDTGSSGNGVDTGSSCDRIFSDDEERPGLLSTDVTEDSKVLSGEVYVCKLSLVDKDFCV